MKRQLDYQRRRADKLENQRNKDSEEFSHKLKESRKEAIESNLELKKMKTEMKKFIKHHEFVSNEDKEFNKCLSVINDIH